jgi:O-antigen biosynthesis protein
MESMLAYAVRRMGIRSSRYDRFVSRVESELLARPRVHRFAQVPAVGAPDAPAARLAVCIDPASEGDAAVTRASLERQTMPPIAVAEAELGEALAATRADWVVRVGAGDRLAPPALERLGQAAALAPDAAIVTADDDIADERGGRRAPRLRPGPSPDLWRVHDPNFALVAVRRDAALGMASQVRSSHHRMLLELSGPAGKGQAHVPMVLCHRRPPVPQEPPATPTGPRHNAEPAVEAIICFRDRPDLLERCARSVLERSSYERLSLRLVDNGSGEARTAEVARILAGDPRVTLESDPRPFNFSALNNAAAARSHAEVLVFLNSDTEIVQEDWIERLLPEALRQEVGAVAPLLLYPDGRVQHAGAAIGLHGWAGHPFAGLAPDEETAFGSAAVGPRNWLAVTAACMVVERRAFLEVGGFDERFQVGGGDVDLCLRLTRAGYRSLSVPAARVVHDESATRNAAAIPRGDFDASRDSYGEFRTLGDPFYHPALDIDDTRCRVRTQPASQA